MDLYHRMIVLTGRASRGTTMTMRVRYQQDDKSCKFSLTRSCSGHQCTKRSYDDMEFTVAPQTRMVVKGVDKALSSLSSSP